MIILNQKMFWSPYDNPLWTMVTFLFTVLLYQQHVSINTGFYQALNNWKYALTCPAKRKKHN